MSCKLPVRTISRCALPFVLTLAAAPSTAFSQSSVCHPIRGGETATRLARRMTGDGRNAYQPWFQIMDESSRFVPKSQYDRIRSGWHGCIVKETTESRVQPEVQLETLAAVQPAVQRETLGADVPVASPQPTSADVIRPIGGVDLMLVWLAAALILPVFGWFVLDNYARRRQAALIVMQHFAQRFVREFERPLIQQQAERPVRSRLRLSPARARMDILLAPGQGRCYPNLSDHRKNVEYDVVRVLWLIADDSFVRDPLYVRAGWVVVPFRLKRIRSTQVSHAYPPSEHRWRRRKHPAVPQDLVSPGRGRHTTG